MKVIEFNNGLWIQYTNSYAYEAPCLKVKEEYYVSIIDYCNKFGIECSKAEFHVSDNKLVLYLPNPTPFEKIAELTSWENITIEPAYGNIAIAIAI